MRLLALATQGTDLALNILRLATGAWHRVSGDAGLPYGNITALGVGATGTKDPVSGAAQLWLGSARGVSLWSADPAADPPWRYLCAKNHTVQ